MNAKKSASNKKYRDGLRILCLDILGNKCAICGCENSAKNGLEFHHMNPTNKTETITKLIRTNPAKLVAELPKCELLCHRCHRKHHYG